MLDSRALRDASVEWLTQLVRPAGYYRQKARFLKDFAGFLFREYDGDLARMGPVETALLRTQLLGVRGIGPETADSILLYALNRPVFVIDAYTRRIVARLGLVDSSVPKTYEGLQDLFEAHLPRSVPLFNEYHALLVNLGKEFCRKRPRCDGCPLRESCAHSLACVTSNTA
jgi:endonuclease-3 related protein